MRFSQFSVFDSGWKSKQDIKSFQRGKVPAYVVNKQHKHKQFEILVRFFFFGGEVGARERKT